MSEAFDLIVVGSGSAAGAVATRCRAAGWTVALVEKGPLGGTCALRGCDPKKVLVGVAAAVDAGRRLAGSGVRADALAVDWPALMRFKRTFTDPVPEARRAGWEEAGIVTMAGAARFAGPARIAVGERMLDARRAIVVATGARPADLPIEGRDHVVTSDGFLDLPRLPASIAFIGGGYVSFEFAHIAARAGAQVTVLHRGARPLEHFDAELVEKLVAHTRTLGVDVRTGTEVRAVEPQAGGYRVRTADGRHLDVDLVVHGAGRVPDLDDLAPAAGNVEVSRAGVVVTEHLRSVSNPMVWAAGDCAATGAPPLTPVAALEGRIVAANLLGTPASAIADPVPSVVYTIPPLAGVGLTEAAARDAGRDVRVVRQDMSGWYSTRRLGESCAGCAIVIDRETDRILGAHLLGPSADETINLFVLAMSAGVPASRFVDMPWAYPTHASDTEYMV